MQKTFTLAATLAALTTLAGSAMAQTPPPPPPVHHGLLGRLFHPKPKPGQPPTGSFGRPGGMMHGHGMPGHTGRMMPMRGGVIGNKNSHVFHLPGDKGALPAPQNRVYFPTAAAAMAAGYHHAGSSHGMTTHRPMMHGSPRTGTPMHGAMPGATR
ncbi:MAG: hypothetical protein M3Y13_04500 [Armatimonadota bacterium]|nr:hypothetical protein [Armatimonadota bacterium]